jgi:hypothetical protein
MGCTLFFCAPKRVMIGSVRWGERGSMDNRNYFIGLGLGLGLVIGLFIGLGLENIALGMPIGVAIGAGLGIVLAHTIDRMN